MAVSQKYNVVDVEKGMLDRRVFVDQGIYQEELEKVFGRTWLMVAHKSLLPNPNDFFLSYIGEDPVIVTRDAKGELHVFLNMCRHRGNRVVRADDGNAKNFMCTYHGWTFSNEGRLVSVPGLQEAYYGELDVERLGLVEARCDTYADLIFATWAEDAPTLEAYLGDARWYLDPSFNRLESGTVAYGPMKWMEPSNWKTSVDNCSDNYHVAVSHYSSALVQARRGARIAGVISHKAMFNSPSKHLFVNGHALTFRVTEENEPRPAHGVSDRNIEMFREYQQNTQAEAERRLGKLRARMQLGNHSLFPNGVLGFRLSQPRGPFMTEFWHFAVVEKDLPEGLRRDLRVGSQGNNGAAGMFEQDDQDNWIQVTHASRSTVGRKYPQFLVMGAGHAGPHPEYPGLLSDKYISENNQRNFYARWQEFMNAESWADIHIDPITARFEGAAAMKG